MDDWERGALVVNVGFVVNARSLECDGSASLLLQDNCANGKAVALGRVAGEITGDQREPKQLDVRAVGSRGRILDLIAAGRRIELHAEKPG